MVIVRPCLPTTDRREGIRGRRYSGPRRGEAVRWSGKAVSLMVPFTVHMTSFRGPVVRWMWPGLQGVENRGVGQTRKPNKEMKISRAARETFIIIFTFICTRLGHEGDEAVNGVK